MRGAYGSAHVACGITKDMLAVIVFGTQRDVTVSLLWARSLKGTLQHDGNPWPPTTDFGRREPQPTSAARVG